MEELRLKAGNEELEVKGSSETIQHQNELEEMNVRAKTEFMERLKNKMSVCAARTASNVKKYLNETIWAQLPEELKAVIGSAQRKWLDKNGNEAEYACKLFLPAASEVLDEDDCYGDEGLYEQLEYYEDRRNRMKGSAEGSDTCGWWLASVRSGVSASACYVNSGGYASNWYASGEHRVPLCFLIKREIS